MMGRHERTPTVYERADRGTEARFYVDFCRNNDLAFDDPAAARAFQVWWAGSGASPLEAGLVTATPRHKAA